MKWHIFVTSFHKKYYTAKVILNLSPEMSSVVYRFIFYIASHSHIKKNIICHFTFNFDIYFNCMSSMNT